MNAESQLDPEERLELLRQHLGVGRGRLGSREAQRRLQQYGPNEIIRSEERSHLRDLARQFTHPLALLLWAAAALAWVAGIIAVAIAIVVVIFVNAIFAFVQERQAERAVEALAAYLPSEARVIRDGEELRIPTTELVPGDVLLIEEGERISADARLLEGSLEIDMSTLTGESAPVDRDAEFADTGVPRLEARDLVFSGTNCVEGEARALVYATGMHTELGRIATLSQRVTTEASPLENQVRKVAWLIALIAVGGAIAFIPIATLVAGLSVSDSIVFAVGLLVGLVPEGLLPVITLALAVGARDLVRRGAVVKRLSAVETLGSTNVICTDKTGTLTENRMRATEIWTPSGSLSLEDGNLRGDGGGDPARLRELATAMVACNNAHLDDGTRELVGDPTEVAILEAASRLGVELDASERKRDRRALFHFDPSLRLMSTVDERGGGLWVDTKGAPEAVLPRCGSIAADGEVRPLGGEERDRLQSIVDGYASQGLRVLAVAQRGPLGDGAPEKPAEAETDLTFLGLVAMLDPPRPEVAAAVESCHQAGLRVIVVTGDHGLTAAAIAKRVGIGTGDSEGRHRKRRRPDDRRRAGRAPARGRGADLRAQLSRDQAEDRGVAARGRANRRDDRRRCQRRAGTAASRHRGGDGAIRHRCGQRGLDDGPHRRQLRATIVAAIEGGRRVYDNVRKFIFYIFAHATPEVTPFVVFALGGGAIPLPLTVLQLLSFDVGTETLPALALGREPAEPGLMRRPPRDRSEGVIRRGMLIRAWLFLGVICAALQMAGFFYVLNGGGWSLGDPTGAGHPLHHTYQQATTMTFLGMVMGQIGTAFAARTERASLRSIGVFSNRLLLWGIAFELALSALIIYAPPLQSVLGTAALAPHMLLFTLPFPFIVWGADELRRWLVRRRAMEGTG